MFTAESLPLLGQAYLGVAVLPHLALTVSALPAAFGEEPAPDDFP